MDAAVTALGDIEPNGRGGGKTNGLRWLADHGFAVPPTWVIADPDLPAHIMRPSLEQVIRPGVRYAVRSSANVEDGGSVSYAGQFVSLLDVEGVDAVLEGAAAVAESSHSASVRSYREHQGDVRPVEMSVIVQEMVPPTFSGVAFSKNPITGLNEIVVEAVPGRGDALLAGGETPDRWVHRWGDYVESPEAADTDARVIDLVVAGTAEIASKYGSPVDVEWVYDGHQVWWVQVRSVTGLDEVTIYSRRIAKEVMPGIIKPLVWSVNVPMVNRAWVDLFTEALGDTNIAPEDLAKPFGYRAYFNMSTIGEIFAALGMPRESLEVLLGLPAGSDQPGFKPTATTFRKTPRLVGMALRKWRYAAEVERQLPILEAEYARFVGRDLKSVSDAQLLVDIGELRQIGVRAASVNIVTPLLANVYTALLRRGLGKSGVDLESIDLMEGVDGRDSFDPNPQLDALGGRIEALSSEKRESIARDGYAGLPADLRAEVDLFIGRFGHFSDAGTDFSVAPWREQPDTVVTMAMDRPARARTSLRASWNTIQREIPAWRRPLMGLLRRRAQTFVQHREAVSSMYTNGYGIFRDYFLEVGARLQDRELVHSADDVMFLTIDEVEAALAGEMPGVAEQVASRKLEMEAVADLELPEVIYGDDFIPRPADDAARTSWQGTPTARGHHRGRVCVVSGIGDFEKVSDGDVLAIPYSDVGWTPLLAKAGAIVAESGGMLSHSSIIAREYGIPCVTSVVGAMRIPDGAVVTVDGYRGVVVLDEEQ